jgi:hypothetical protein
LGSYPEIGSRKTGLISVEKERTPMPNFMLVLVITGNI